ncbi:hypothetical protein KZZ52_52530 [Dactylosporangium sp. AC04546]|nr:hypothetical protein [Dactylosporangium sp. AC04546]WVK89803.1 hypothetical protein KZZ52_52530 [Dactylosporangium sp. AC04546]
MYVATADGVHTIACRYHYS